MGYFDDSSLLSLDDQINYFNLIEQLDELRC